MLAPEPDLINSPSTENVYKPLAQFGHKQTESVGLRLRKNIDRLQEQKSLLVTLFLICFCPQPEKKAERGDSTGKLQELGPPAVCAASAKGKANKEAETPCGTKSERGL